MAYQLEAEKKIPAYLLHLRDLLGVYSGLSKKDVRGKSPYDDSTTFWTIQRFELRDNPSSIEIRPQILHLAASPAGADTRESLGDSFQVQNEGFYALDFSIGIPVRRLRELKFESTANTVTAKNVDGQNAFALVNLHLKPVDIVDRTYSPVPHVVAGVALARRPLDKILVGMGWGPSFAHFYVGAAFVKERHPSTLATGDPATPLQLSSDLRTKYKPQVAFGINLPVGAFIETVKKASK